MENSIENIQTDVKVLRVNWPICCYFEQVNHQLGASFKFCEIMSIQIIM